MPVCYQKGGSYLISEKLSLHHIIPTIYTTLHQNNLYWSIVWPDSSKIKSFW